MHVFTVSEQQTTGHGVARVVPLSYATYLMLTKLLISLPSFRSLACLLISIHNNLITSKEGSCVVLAFITRIFAGNFMKPTITHNRQQFNLDCVRSAVLSGLDDVARNKIRCCDRLCNTRL